VCHPLSKKLYLPVFELPLVCFDVQH
jgi:hypothetical protein